MKMTSRSGPLSQAGAYGLGLAMAALAAGAATGRADTVVSGTYLGANGQPGNASTSTDSNGIVTNSGQSGTDGYNPPTTGAYAFTPTAAATAGNGANIVGTDPAVIYQGGSGGTGVSTSTAGTALTFNGGSYTGGNAGSATGTGYALLGGSGGNGAYVGSGATATVNAGTFTGGAHGTVSGTQDPGVNFSFVAGFGFAVQGTSALTVTGGTFTGGAAESTDNYGAGLILFGSTADLYGGTFNAGSAAAADNNNDFDKGLFLFGGTATLYGTHFAVDGVPVTSGQVAEQVGTITGLLEDNGVQTSITFDNNNSDGTIDLVDLAAPEPTSLALFAVGGVGLLARRGQRRPRRDA